MTGFATKASTAFRIALRELRGGLKGFYIFLACIALGTGSIAAVNSVATAITGSIASEGRTLLAGDVRFELNNREAGPTEMRFLEGLGDVAVSTVLRSMARLPDGSDQSLVEVKAVDGAYPLYGAFVAEPARPLSELLAQKDGAYGAVAAPLLLERLGLSVGDAMLIGKARVVVTGTIVTEPDAISDGFGFAPRLVTSREALKASGLVDTGSLVEHAYKIRLAPTAPSGEALRQKAQSELPDAGWSIRPSDRAAPSLTENVERFSQFLTLVGLTALVVGGVGVANAVRAFLDSKRTVIATLKCLGAPASVVVMVYLFQIAMVASIGIVAGLVLGAVAPMVAAYYLSGILPISPEPTLYPGALLLAAVFGLLVTLAFAILPLGHSRQVPATALFREQGFEPRQQVVQAHELAGIVGADHRVDEQRHPQQWPILEPDGILAADAVDQPHDRVECIFCGGQPLPERRVPVVDVLNVAVRFDVPRQRNEKHRERRRDRSRGEALTFRGCRSDDRGINSHVWSPSTRSGGQSRSEGAKSLASARNI